MTETAQQHPTRIVHKGTALFEKGDDMLTVASSLLAGTSSNRHHTLIKIDPPIEIEDHLGKPHKRTHFKMTTDQVYRNRRNQSVVMTGKLTSVYTSPAWDIRIKIVKKEERMDVVVTMLHNTR